MNNQASLKTLYLFNKLKPEDMSKNIIAKRLKFIIAATLLFVSYNSFSQINKSSSTLNKSDTSTVKQIQDYNSSRGIKSINTDRTKQVSHTNDEIVNDSLPRPAQDYNSSRSNRPTPVRDINDTIESDSASKFNVVKDYNSNLKSRLSDRLLNDDELEKDTMPKINKAQDYNSSRSNKPRPISIKNDTIKENRKQKKLQN